jgi:omega-amidase
MSSLKVALIQTDIHWMAPQKNLEQMAKRIEQIESVDLIVLPETFATGFAFDKPGIGEIENGPVLNWMKQTAQSSGAVVAGSVAVNKAGKNANRMYWVTPQGDVQFYEKRHLFRMGSEHNHVVAGDQRKVFNLKGFRILPTICYDLRFPVWSRNRNDYDVLLNVANWPGVRRKVWDTLLCARAMENQCYVVAVNRVGDDGNAVAHSGGTAVYDFKGNTLSAATDNQSQVLIQTLDLKALNDFKKQFPAYLDGDDFELLPTKED